MDPDAAVADAAPSNPAADLPLLGEGSHLGTIIGFNAQNPVATEASIAAHWDEAVAAGMNVGRVQLDWVELEPTSGQFDMSELEDALTLLSADGVKPFLLLPALDDASALPLDLATRVEAGELTFASPEIIARFKLLLDWVVPMLLSHNGWVLAIANEPGNVFDDLDAAEAMTKATELATFTREARDHVHSLEPRLAVTVTLREDLTLASNKPYLATLLEPVDVVSFNFYCSRFADNLNVETSVTAIEGYIDRMLTTAGDKQLLIQELGCHAGRAGGLTGATEALQVQFHQTVYAKLASEERFRAAIVFQLVDWDPALVESFFSQPFRDAGVPEDFILRFAESLETVGFLNYADGAERPAWQTFIDAL